MHQWYLIVSSRLKDLPNGPQQLCTMIFGVDGVNTLAEKGQLRTRSSLRRTRNEQDDGDLELVDERPRRRRRT